MINHKVIEKIQKLLSLANSDNENEAKNATRMANELLLKYNLSIQSVKDHQSEYEKQDLAKTGFTIQPHQNLITNLLQEYFFVRVIINSQYAGESSGKYGRTRARFVKTIKLVGTKENCQIAGYIFEYLNSAYPKLWKDFYNSSSRITKSQKVSYYTGLTVGISEMLKATRWRVQEETGLVLVEDPALKEFASKDTTGTYNGQSNSDIDPKIFAKGVIDGSKITLRKPLENKSEDTGLKLAYSK